MNPQHTSPRSLNLKSSPDLGHAVAEGMPTVIYAHIAQRLRSSYVSKEPSVVTDHVVLHGINLHVPRNDNTIWADSYDRDLIDIFAIQAK